MEVENDLVTEEESILQRRKEHQAVFKGIGITFLVLSVLAIISTIVTLGVSYYSWWTPYLNTGAGIWGDLMVIPLGILLILIVKNTSRCLVIWTFTWSVVASFFLFVTMVLSFCGFIYNSNMWRANSGGMAVHVCLFAVSLTQLVLSLYVAVRFGKVCCSNSHEMGCSDMWSGCCWPQRSDYKFIYQPSGLYEQQPSFA